MNAREEADSSGPAVVMGGTGAQSARPVTARASRPRLGIGVTGKTSSDTRLTLGLTWLLWASRPPVGLVIASTTLHLRCTVSAIAYGDHGLTSDGAREVRASKASSWAAFVLTGEDRVGKGLRGEEWCQVKN